MTQKVYKQQWRIQDLKEEGARSIAREARARKIFSHAPKNVDHAPHLLVLEDSWLTKKAVLGLVTMRKRCFKERNLETSKFIVGRSCQLSIRPSLII